jgi:rare lipoprotein A
MTGPGRLLPASAVSPSDSHVSRFVLLAALVAALAAPATSAQTVTPGGRRAEARRGVASFYAASLHGRPTASGARYDRGAFTAAHRTLAFGTVLRVTNERNGRVVYVRVNDRGPFHRGRVLDLSNAAAQSLGIGGTASVSFEIVPRDEAPARMGPAE